MPLASESLRYNYSTLYYVLDSARVKEYLQGVYICRLWCPIDGVVSDRFQHMPFHGRGWVQDEKTVNLYCDKLILKQWVYQDIVYHDISVNYQKKHKVLQYKILRGNSTWRFLQQQSPTPPRPTTQSPIVQPGQLMNIPPQPVYPAQGQQFIMPPAGIVLNNPAATQTAYSVRPKRGGCF